MKDDREIEFWSVDDSREELTCRDIDDAIYEYLDDDHDGPIDENDTVEVHGYARREVSMDHKWVLKVVLEELDQEYSWVHQPDTKPTDDMLIAAKEFVDTICKLYKPWACDVVCTETVNLFNWCTEHDLELLEYKNKKNEEEQSI